MIAIIPRLEYNAVELSFRVWMDYKGSIKPFLQKEFLLILLSLR